ncbi:MAG: Fic family protein, partial [Nitriliruptorales bacterium]
MTGETRPSRFDRTPHLVTVVAESDRLAALLAAAEPAAEEVAAGRARAAVASLRLDGSPVTEPPTELPSASIDLEAGDLARTTWLDVLRSARADGEADDDVLPAAVALEYRGVREALDADDLIESLLATPSRALADLHARLVRGLVPESEAGRVRRTRQAVHDASIGRVIYNAAPPDAIEPRLALLDAWASSTGAREHALVVSGVVHHELLAVHPFESANGRLARTAARLLLRGRGLDPHGIAAIEEVLAEDPLGYHEEVARTLHRRDLTIWLERWGEAVAAGLRRAARDLDLLDPAIPRRAAAFVHAREGPFTIADYRADAGVGSEEARADL